MKKVGFIYTFTVQEVCQPHEMLHFFQKIENLTKSRQIKLDILPHRLYNKYLTFDQLDEAEEEVILIEKVSAKEDMDQYICTSLRKIINSAQYFKKQNDYYAPIRIVLTEIPELFEDKFRDLSEYDNLQGPPFWLREYLQEYPDTVLPFE